MKSKIWISLIAFLCSGFAFVFPWKHEIKNDSVIRKTKVSIEGDKFLINGTPTYQGQFWNSSSGKSFPIEGLLFNSRMVQGIFDDLNEKTSGQWNYPDTKKWDADRNTEEFIRAMPSWKEHGLLGFTLNLQGGCPYGYCKGFPWDNSAFNPDGSLRDSFMNRAESIIDKADDLGMVVILGLFYFGEDQSLIDEEAVKTAVKNAVLWVLEKGYSNVLIEINNECSVPAYDHDILKCHRVHELISLAKEIVRNEKRLYVSTSLAGGQVPLDEIVALSDFILIHGNGVQNPERIQEISEEIRSKSIYSPKPLVNNEDDIPWRNPDQGWQTRDNNFVASVENFTSWGYFDFRLPEENHDYNLGYQSIPVNWQISSDRKSRFFNLLAQITGSPGTPKLVLDFSGNFGEVKKILVSGGPDKIQIIQFEWIINNKIVARNSEIPETFDFRAFSQSELGQEHWIKGRLTYKFEQKEIIVESPYYKNPWWPYGGQP
ncbi:hypothetical protein [Shivajiella indica]|uniref:Glycoside hydrolase family 5 domain-containing protein n=1 Tax=Shivajiella indica TaxID=872115 RepID=A0ABW5BCG7_9BACT